MKKNNRHSYLVKEHTRLKKYVTDLLKTRNQYKEAYNELIAKANRDSNEDTCLKYWAFKLKKIREDLRFANRKLLIVKIEIRECHKVFNMFRKNFKF